MKRHIILILICFCFAQVYSQKQKLYNPGVDGKLQVSSAVQLADSLGKNVFVQIGGNWCPWCLKFNKFCNENQSVDTLLRNNYVVVHLNYSPENKNKEVLKSFDNPQRFGFPVIVILDSKGNRVHTQDTALLEKDGSYDLEKVVNFIRYWTIKSINTEIK